MNASVRQTPNKILPGVKEQVKAANLLTLPAAQGARIIAVSHLDSAVAAYHRIDDPDDVEALHDFRVALRRLRSCIHAYQAYLSDTVSKKSKKRLQGLARVTNEARDTEVQIEWLRSQEKKLPPRQRNSWGWLLDRLELRKAQAYAEIRATMTGKFSRFEYKLRTELQTYAVSDELDSQSEGVSLAAATAEKIRKFCKKLEKNQREIESSNDQLAIHVSRIWLKRLRYLLEPLQEEIDDWPSMINPLKDVQNILGKLHDTHFIALEIALAVEDSAALHARRLLDIALHDADPLALRAEKRRSEHAGLVTLARLANLRTNELFAELGENYLNGGLNALIRRMMLTGQNLTARAAQNYKIVIPV